MRIVLTGANTTALYEYEHSLLANLPPQIQRLTFNAHKQTVADLRDQLGAQSMFQSTRVWRVTNLEKNRSTKQRQEILTPKGSDRYHHHPNELTPAQSSLLLSSQGVRCPKSSSS